MKPNTSITISMKDVEPMKSLLEEALDANCKHDGEDWAGSGSVSCYDECGGCSVRTLAYSIVDGTWEK